MTESPKPKAKILIADHDPFCRELLAEGLRLAGYQVVVAADVVEAYALALQERPGLVCVEVQLPRGGLEGAGLEFCRMLKAEFPVTVIMMAKMLDDALSSQMASCGAEDLLFKPFDLDEAIDKMMWFLPP